MTIEGGIKYSREERILQSHRNPDGLLIYPQFLDILTGIKNQPNPNPQKIRSRSLPRLVVVGKGLPGNGKTTTTDGIQHTIEREFGQAPLRISFDTVRAEYLESISTNDRVVSQLKDLTKKEKEEFEKIIIETLTVRSGKGKQWDEFVIIEAPCFGDELVKTRKKKMVERGQSALQAMLRDPNVNSLLAIFDIFATNEVFDLALQVREAARQAPDDYTLKVFLKKLGVFEGDYSTSDIEKQVLISVYRKMASVEQMKSIQENYDQLAHLFFVTMLVKEKLIGKQGLRDVTFEAMLEGVKKGFVDQRNQPKNDDIGANLLDDVYRELNSLGNEIDGLSISISELEKITIRILYSYQELRSMRFPVVPLIQNGVVVQSARLFTCINQLVRNTDRSLS